MAIFEFFNKCVNVTNDCPSLFNVFGAAVDFGREFRVHFVLDQFVVQGLRDAVDHFPPLDRREFRRQVTEFIDGHQQAPCVW